MIEQSAGYAMGDVTLLLNQIESGELDAQERLMPLVYEELRRIASSKLSREFSNITLQPTALVHEAWLRLGGDDQTGWKNRRHFLGAAAEAMRRILIDRARRRHTQRRGGDFVRVELPDDVSDESGQNDERLLALSESLERFRQIDESKYELVRLRYFAGLTLEQAAETLEVSPATAKRWWAFTRAWLLRDMNDALKPIPQSSSDTET